MSEKIYIYRVPSISGKAAVDLPDFTIKDNKGNVKGTHIKKWIIRDYGRMIEIHTDKEYKELEKYKV